MLASTTSRRTFEKYSILGLSGQRGIVDSSLCGRVSRVPRTPAPGGGAARSAAPPCTMCTGVVLLTV